MIPNNNEDWVFDYQNLWINQYNNKKILSEELEAKITIKVLRFLDIDQNLDDQREKEISGLIKLLDYLTKEGYLLMNHDPYFFRGVVDRIKQFLYYAPEMFDMLNPTTRQFVYAATGIK